MKFFLLGLLVSWFIMSAITITAYDHDWLDKECFAYIVYAPYILPALAVVRLIRAIIKRRKKNG